MSKQKDSLSRRKFLGISAAAAGASLAAKTILLEPEPLFALATAASDRVRLPVPNRGLEVVVGALHRR